MDKTRASIERNTEGLNESSVTILAAYHLFGFNYCDVVVDLAEEIEYYTKTENEILLSEVI